jgi:hypothetical protein
MMDKITYKKEKVGTMMKKMIVLLSLLLIVLAPKASYSQGAATKDLRQLDEGEVLDIRNRLTESAEKLSSIGENLKCVCTAMGASQPEERFLTMHSRENIMNISGIYRYMADNLDELLLIKKDKVPYYAYLKEYGLEQMRRLQDEYFDHVLSIQGQISSAAASHPIDEAARIIRSSSGLLDKAIDIIKQQGKTEHQISSRHRTWVHEKPGFQIARRQEIWATLSLKKKGES